MATDTQLAEMDIATSALAERFDSLVTHGEGGAIHNYAGTSEQMFIFTSKCTGSEVLPGGEHVGDIIGLKYWYVFPVQFEDGMGEITTGLRTVLVAADGQTYGFGSSGIAASLLRVVQAYGAGPWEQPIALRISQTQTRKGRRFFRLEPASMDLDA